MDVREVSAEDVELEYVSAAGIRERGSLGRLWPVRFESVRPERRFPAFRGQGNWCGWYWSATCGGHVGYESWLERDRLMLLDFDPLVTGMSSQPFRLSWAGAGGRRVRHTPDFFVRRTDGTALVFYLVQHGEYDVPGMYIRGGKYWSDPATWTHNGVNLKVLIAFVIGVVSGIPAMSNAWYVGPIARHFSNTDLSWIPGMVVTSVVYLALVRVGRDARGESFTAVASRQQTSPL